MATYQFYRSGYAMPMHRAGEAPFRRNINIPNLITNGTNAGLANTSDVRTALPSTGFASGDVLRTFDVPAGFAVRMVGANVTTAEGAACTADIGNNSATQTHRLASNPDGMMGTFNLNSETCQITLIADEDVGGSTYEAVVFITNGTIDITFGSNDTDTAVFDVFACGYKCW